MRSIVRRKVPWAIAVIATLVLLACVSSSTSVKLRKPRRRPMTRVPYQQSRVAPVIIRVIHKYSDDEPARGVSSNCTRNVCANPRDKFESGDVDEALSEQDNFLPDDETLRYIVYPKRYEHFVSRKNTRHVSHRHKRDAALPESRLSNASDNGDNANKALRSETKGKLKKAMQQKVRKSVKIKNPSRSPSEADRTRRSLDDDYIAPWNASDHAATDNASKALKNENKAKLKKVMRQKAFKNVKAKDPLKSTSVAGRTRRSLGGYTARRNASDYYAQRQAVMERYYARQREINARYANRTADISPLRQNAVPQHHPATSNATLFRFEYGYPNKDAAMRGGTTTSRYPRIDPTFSESLNNRVELDNRRDVIAPENDLDFNAASSQNRSNIVRNALDPYVTTTPCGPTAGTFAPKPRPKPARNCSEDSSERNNNTGTGYQSWGVCRGKLVYQHNLLLGLTGPSNLDAEFEVIIQGPVCITCVETLRYNETRAEVTLQSGGRGFDFVRLELKGYENEGFFYIIKVWGVQKVGRDCNSDN